MTLAASLLAAPLVASSCTCADRPLDDPALSPAEPACLWLISPLAHLADGSVRTILDLDGVVDDECLDYYETGRWLKDIYFARGDWANGAPPGFSCADP